MASETNDLIAKVFVLGPPGGDRSTLFDCLATALGATRGSHYTARTMTSEFEVRVNPDGDPAAADDDWLAFPSVVEIYRVAPDGRDLPRTTMDEVAALLGVLDSIGAAYVTASEWESELPGYGRTVDLE